MSKRIELSDEQIELAVLLRDYIRDRAAVEQQSFDLPLSLFAMAVLRGMFVFGLHHDGKRLVRDDQEPYPGYFREWNGFGNN